ncbi:restriction endonuclease subunit S [Calidifontibacter terrae]
MSALPNGWRAVTPHQISGADKTRLVIGPFGSNLKTTDYRTSGVPLVFVRDIRARDFKNVRAFVEPEKAQELAAHLVRPGDVLITKMGEPPGDSTVYSGAGPAVITADCIRLRPTDDFNAKFVAYAIQAPAIKQQIERITSGVAQRKVSLARFRSGLSIPTPHLREQLRIVEILEDHLSRLDAAAEYVSAAHHRINSLRRSQLDGLFGGVGPRVPIRHLVNRIESGRSLGGSAAPATEDEWGIIKVSAMTWGRFRPDENKAIPADQANPKYEIHKGDLLVSRANTADYVGASVLVGDAVPPKLLLSDKSLRLVPMADVDVAWLWRTLQSPSVREQISRLATGTKDSMRNISQTSLLSVEVPEASPEAQRRAVVEYDALEEKSMQLESEADRLAARQNSLRRAILAAAFSGKLTGHRSDDEVVEELAGALA